MHIFTTPDTKNNDLLKNDNLDTAISVHQKMAETYNPGDCIGQWQVKNAPIRMLGKNAQEINQTLSPVKYSAVLLSHSASITHALPSLMAKQKYTLSWENSLSQYAEARAGYTHRLIALTADNVREEIFNKTYSADNGQIAAQWQTASENITIACDYTSAELTLSGWGGCIISRIDCILHPAWDVVLISPATLMLRDNAEDALQQAEDWSFYVSDSQEHLPHPTLLQSLFISINGHAYPALNITEGITVIPADTLVVPKPVSDPIVLTLSVDNPSVGQHDFPVSLTDTPDERLIFSPALSTMMLSAPVDGFFNNGLSINVQTETLTNGRWCVRPNGRIKAELLSRSDNAPFFSGVQDKYTFRGQMLETRGACLPLLRGSVHVGAYTLKISDEEHPQVTQSLTLQVTGIHTFTPPEPVDYNSVSRDWITEEGRWMTQALCADERPAKYQPVEFRLIPSPACNVKFQQSGQLTQSGITGKNGYVAIPPVVVPDDDASFDIHVDAGDDATSDSGLAQTHIPVSITERPVVHLLEAMTWPKTVKNAKPEAFSVRMTDIAGNFITSGVNVTFLITNNSAGAHFRRTGRGENDSDTTNIVPATLNYGFALTTCLPVECTGTGTFTLTAIAQSVQLSPVDITVTA